jgi:hypothetical protein
VTAYTREQVYTALFARLQGLSGFVTWTRRMLLPGQAAEQPQNLPMLVLWEGPEDTEVGEEQGFRLPVDEWHAAVVIYFINPSDTVPGSTIINPLLDAVRKALGPTDLLNNVNDLGLGIQGLWCRVEGKTAIETGDTDSKGLGGAVVPIMIRVPVA